MPFGVHPRMDVLSLSMLAGAGGALLIGLTASLHCVLMCGPLACAAVSKQGNRWVPMLGWHVGRIGGYTLVGALLGSLGKGVVLTLSTRVEPFLPWVFAAGLVATALNVGKHWPALPGIGRVGVGIARLSQRLPATARVVALGAATPLLPCGVLYGVFLSAVATGKALDGAVTLFAFSLGAVPLLATAQWGSRRLPRNPRLQRALQTAVPLLAATMLIWRALATHAAGEPPHCH